MPDSNQTPKTALLRYDLPGTSFNEALPLGNGRLGAMIRGAPLAREDYFSERIPLNEDSLWYGGSTRRDNPDAAASLAEVRALLRAGKVQEAEYLADSALTAIPRNGHPYQHLGELVLVSPENHAPATDYERTLDLDRAIASVHYRHGDSLYLREQFVSAPAQVFALHLQSVGTPLVFHAYLRRRPFDGEVRLIDHRTVALEGQAGPDGVRFCLALRMLGDEGQLMRRGQSLHCVGGQECVLLVAANTSFRQPNPLDASLPQLDAAEQAGYAALRQAHIEDHQALYRRMKLTLASDSPPPSQTDAYIQNQSLNRPEPAFDALMFDYGRYLTIASSRPGTLPINLQGLWCDQMTPIWNCNYTLNINLQMEYWPAEVCGLPECHEPLFAFVDRLVESGRQTAQTHYGCRGFVAHHTSDLWADTLPTGGVYASGLWPLGGAWLALHSWEHYRFTLDRGFLARTALPQLREAALFFEDYLEPNAQGHLVASPSVSPENAYLDPTGCKRKMCAGASMDAQILRELFNALIQASEILGHDAGERARWAALRDALPPIRATPEGIIAEWLGDERPADPGHRHLSPLFAIFPGSQIHPFTHPDLAQAAARSIGIKRELRTDQTGWSLAWMACIYARLLDGDAAQECLRRLACEHTLPNLLNDCPPLNLDGNFGHTAAIAELLLQSHRDELHLLPALPSAWLRGEVSGLRARGGFSVDLEWTDGTLRRARITAAAPGPCRLRVNCPLHSPTHSNLRFTAAEAGTFSASINLSPVTPLILERLTA